MTTDSARRATASDELRTWVAEQIEQYVDVLAHYDRYAEVIDQVLHRATAELAPLAIVQTRRKSVTSFAEKCLRKRSKHPDPVHQFTDLCGARIIARTRSEVDTLCRFLEERFDVDRENSIDASKRLLPSEFGYRSVHYIVSLRTDIDYGLAVPDEVLGLRAEIQVRTTTEHAYSDFAHDLTYKGAFDLPVAWRRELAGAAATLEEVDAVFSRIEEGVCEYASNYGRYLPDEEQQAEIARLELVLEHDPGNADLADRLARLAMARGDWKLVVAVLTPLFDAQPQPPSSAVQRDLGIALCELHRGHPAHPDYRTGQECLARASESGDVDALCAYAGTWKETDPSRARELYRQAFELDPTNPYALGNYLELELDRDHGSALLDSIRPLLQQAIQRCEHQVVAGTNLPWALFDLGRFHLLRNEPHEALAAYAEAVAFSSSAWVVETSLSSLERMVKAMGGRAGVEWSRRLLMLALAARFGDQKTVDRLRTLATPDAVRLSAPVTIVAGATLARMNDQMAAYGDLVNAALADFEGTVLSGGTSQGICGIVGAIGRARGCAIRTIGYLPQLLPVDATADPDYDEIRQTHGHGFTPLEPLQNWIDLVASGVKPEEVRVLGINGGQIAAAEYRIALALGATVGLVAESGREAGRLLADDRWNGQRLVRLPADRETLRAFLAPTPASLPEQIRERIARSIHDSYRRERQRNAPETDPGLTEWEALPDDLRASNLAQADAIAAKLTRIDCVVVAARSRGATATMSDDEIELLAEVEHGRWTAERLLAGWSRDEERDVDRRRSPYLVEWQSLSSEIRQRDREAVRAIPGLLAEVGLGIGRGGTPQVEEAGNGTGHVREPGPG